jgi:hypothetical protein
VHDHHQIAKPVPGPAAQPTDLPIAEARANCNWCREAQKFRFQWHWCLPQSTHSLLENAAQSSCGFLRQPRMGNWDCSFRGDLRRFGSRLTSGWACPTVAPDGSVNTPPGSTTLFSAQIMPTRMPSNSSGISAAVILGYECHRSHSIQLRLSGC